MTTHVITARPDERVEEVRARLAEPGERIEVDAVALVDDRGVLIDDVSVVDLLVADGNERLEELVSPSEPVTVGCDAPLADVVDHLIESRRSSLLVIDALVPNRGRHRLHVRLP
jgi:Mg/Co/Ni transporter MgtE